MFRLEGLENKGWLNHYNQIMMERKFKTNECIQGKENTSEPR